MLPSPVFGRLSDWIGPVCWLWTLPPQPSSIQDPLEGGCHPDALAFRIWMVKSFGRFSNVIELLDHGIRAKFWAWIESHVAPEACRPLLRSIQVDERGWDAILCLLQQEFENVLDQAPGQALLLIGSGYSKLANEIGRDGGRTIFDAL